MEEEEEEELHLHSNLETLTGQVGNAKHWISCESQCENIIIQPKMLKHVHSD